MTFWTFSIVVWSSCTFYSDWVKVIYGDFAFGAFVLYVGKWQKISFKVCDIHAEAWFISYIQAIRVSNMLQQ